VDGVLLMPPTKTRRTKSEAAQRREDRKRRRHERGTQAKEQTRPLEEIASDQGIDELEDFIQRLRGEGVNVWEMAERQRIRGGGRRLASEGGAPPVEPEKPMSKEELARTVQDLLSSHLVGGTLLRSSAGGTPEETRGWIEGRRRRMQEGQPPPPLEEDEGAPGGRRHRPRRRLKKLVGGGTTYKSEYNEENIRERMAAVEDYLNEFFGPQGAPSNPSQPEYVANPYGEFEEEELTPAEVVGRQEPTDPEYVAARERFYPHPGLRELEQETPDEAALEMLRQSLGGERLAGEEEYWGGVRREGMEREHAQSELDREGDVDLEGMSDQELQELQYVFPNNVLIEAEREARARERAGPGGDLRSEAGRNAPLDFLRRTLGALGSTERLPSPQLPPMPGPEPDWTSIFPEARRPGGGTYAAQERLPSPQLPPMPGPEQDWTTVFPQGPGLGGGTYRSQAVNPELLKLLGPLLMSLSSR
jgi:hypothetical protein